MNVPNLISTSSREPAQDDIGSGAVQGDDMLDRMVEAHGINEARIYENRSMWERVKSGGTRLMNGVEQACTIL